MNEAYFKDIPNIGDLYLDCVFYEFECEPILFLCRDNRNNLYFCLCSEIRDQLKWIIMRIGLKELEELASKKIDIMSSFLKNDKLVVITYDSKNVEKSIEIEADKIDKLDLPKEGIYIRCNKKDIEDYLKEKKKTETIKTIFEISTKNVHSSHYEIKSYIMDCLTNQDTELNGKINQDRDLFNYSLSNVKKYKKNSIKERYDAILKGDKEKLTVPEVPCCILQAS